jgi:Fe-S cluster biogenesis protein NfuA
MSSAEETGRQIERLLTELRAGPDPRAGTAAEELSRLLVQLYGDGLARIAAMLGPDRLAELAADPLVASLLLVHDLHPVPVAERIRQALHGSGAELLAVEETGVVRLRLRSAAPGCGSARQGTLREIETVVRRAAPEVTDVDVSIPPPEPPLLQVSLRPGLVRRTS